MTAAAVPSSTGPIGDLRGRSLIAYSSSSVRFASSSREPPPGSFLSDGDDDEVATSAASAEDEVEGKHKRGQPREHADHGSCRPSCSGPSPGRVESDRNDHRQPTEEHERVEEIERVRHAL